MEQIHSSEKEITAPQRVVFDVLSNVDNLTRLKERIPEDQLKDIVIGEDSISYKSPMGMVTLKLVEKEPNKTIKYSTVQSPLPFDMWVQLLPITGSQCKMRVTVGLNMNSFMMAMVKKPLTDAVEKIAGLLAQIPYSKI
ncbi:MAG: SRPBCC family protein [Bacteroidaceae bacterium]|nr:SRPBCC family protein [Bacteroidaceae bacterium]MBR2161029.1 SRPBCC family protein [Bacteroidaceae bacterium]MBR3015058.1 SRPBCC family protein [Bacteroidaceae bacterium]MBR3624801.1 SRPBCC family protein [Bacteroidaceae bacterium]